MKPANSDNSVLYGMGALSLAETLATDTMAAERLIKSFKKKYPRVDEYHRKIIDSCMESGFIVTILNRRRYLPKINSRSISERYLLFFIVGHY